MKASYRIVLRSIIISVCIAIPKIMVQFGATCLCWFHNMILQISMNIFWIYLVYDVKQSGFSKNMQWIYIFKLQQFDIYKIHFVSYTRYIQNIFMLICNIILWNQHKHVAPNCTIIFGIAIQTDIIIDLKTMLYDAFIHNQLVQ